jgi:tol-pal system protein YbgF
MTGISMPFETNLIESFKESFVESLKESVKENLKYLRAGIVLCWAVMTMPAWAGLLDDDEARKAILDLRTEVRKRDADQTQGNQVLADQIGRLGAATSDNLQRLKAQQDEQAKHIELLRRNVLDLNNTLTAIKEDNAKLRGQIEVLINAQQSSNQASQVETQLLRRRVQDLDTSLDARLKKLEPRTVAIDGKEALLERAEETSFNAALNQFKAADYKSSARAFEAFVVQYPQSSLQASAQFWLGNSQYAAKDSKAALVTLQNMMQKFPQHTRAADAYLTMGHCYEDMNDKKRSAELYQYVISAFPDTPQAQAAQEAMPKKAIAKNSVNTKTTKPSKSAQEAKKP